MWEISWCNNNNDIGVNDFVLVKYCAKKTDINYTGNNSSCRVQFWLECTILTNKE